LPAIFGQVGDEKQEPHQEVERRDALDLVLLDEAETEGGDAHAQVRAEHEKRVDTHGGTYNRRNSLTTSSQTPLDDQFIAHLFNSARIGLGNIKQLSHLRLRHVQHPKVAANSP